MNAAPKRIEIEELPEGWIEINLNTAVESMKNGLYKPANEYAEHGIACLRMYNIDGGRIIWKNVKRMLLSSDEVNEYNLAPGDLLVNRVNSRELVGKTAVFPRGLETCVYESKNIRVRLLSELVNSNFVNYQLLLFGQHHFNYNSQQVVGMASISQPQIGDFPLLLSPRIEQDRIVSKMQATLAKVAKSSSHIANVAKTLKRFRQAVLAAACSGRLTEDWRGDSAHDWKECTLGQILREPLRNGHSARASFNGSGVRTLTLSAVTYGDFSERNTKLTVADPRRVSDLWLIPGDILIERSNSRELVGTARLYQGAAKFAIFPDLLIRVRLNEEASPSFLEMMLQVDSARNYFINSAQGTQGSMPKIDQQIILDFPLQLPSMEEQKEIVQRVTVLLTLASRIEQRVTAAKLRADKLSQSILAKAFRGELVPTEAELARREGREYEPASVLLERIKREKASLDAAKTLGSKGLAPRGGKRRTVLA